MIPVACCLESCIVQYYQDTIFKVAEVHLPVHILCHVANEDLESYLYHEALKILQQRPYTRPVLPEFGHFCACTVPAINSGSNFPLSSSFTSKYSHPHGAHRLSILRYGTQSSKWASRSAHIRRGELCRTKFK